MKSIVLLFIASVSIGGFTYLSKVGIEASSEEIIFKQKSGVAYFYAPSTGEILFIQHAPSLKIDYKQGDVVGYDLTNGQVTLSGEGGQQKQILSTKSSSGNGVLGIGIRRVPPGNYNDDDIFARDCGCFNDANPPTVNNRPAQCSNNNPTLSTGCGSGGSASAGITILATGATGGGGTSCNVTCAGGAYACCIDKGKFDVDQP